MNEGETIVRAGEITKQLIFLVPPGRLELPRPCEQQILSLPRLPVPPQGPATRRRAVSLVRAGS
jgi:hypothetical protein